MGVASRSKARRCAGVGVGDLVDLMAADGDGLAGEGGQVIEQVAEAAGRLAPGFRTSS